VEFLPILCCVLLCQVLGAFLLVTAVHGGHLDQSGGYGFPAVSSYGAPVASPSYKGYSGGYNGGGYSSGGYGGYDEQVYYFTPHTVTTHSRHTVSHIRCLTFAEA
jgi:uncharacterized membrane protein